jgi:hypothetical protein
LRDFQWTTTHVISKLGSVTDFALGSAAGARQEPSLLVKGGGQRWPFQLDRLSHMCVATPRASGLRPAALAVDVAIEAQSQNIVSAAKKPAYFGEFQCAGPLWQGNSAQVSMLRLQFTA